LHNARSRSGCRFKVYRLAEKNHAKVREDDADDGIAYYGLVDLIVRLLFEDKIHAEEFESSLADIPMDYGKRAFTFDRALLDLSVGEINIQPVRLKNVVLRRIMKADYKPVEGDGNPSPLYDTITSSLMSHTSVVVLNEETLLRLVDRPDSHNLFRQKPEKCHLMSQTKYPCYANNPNNVVFMSRLLHQHFDIIDSTEAIATFYLEYVSHSEQPMDGLINQKPCPVYETLINVRFKDEIAKNVLAVDFKDYSEVNADTIQIALQFPQPLEFKAFAEHKAKPIKEDWKWFDGEMED